MSKSIAYRHHLRALSRWPKDALRPNLQFQDVIRRRIDRRLGLITADSKNNKEAAVSTLSPPSTVWNETVELEQANILYSLLEDRYARKYPLTKLLTPNFNPTYYKDIVKEIEEAPNRSWWEGKLKSWKGFLRFK